MSSSRAMRVAILVVVLAVAAVAGCDRRSAERSRPLPSEVLAEATGYYCGMRLAEHEGPKGQVYLASRSEPIWFSSVRDTIAFTRLPEEPREIAAIYVNDMGRARNWAQPEPGTWIDARKAWFVIDSDVRGGMGAPEAVPFSDPAAAEAFQAQHRGRVVQLADVPDSYVLGPVDLVLPAPAASSASAARHASGH